MSDDSDDENNCRYGTPLESYDEDEIPKKKPSYQDVSEQYALDSQGKRRFHGAFTGGFTAGYGNTVALPEGFTPSSFKSSRADRMKKSQFQKPEDFMDEEDRSEFGIAPKEIQTTREFGGQKRKKQTQFHDGPIPGEPVLQMLLQPVHETAAMRILRSMGWRPGKGVGEKLTAKEKSRARKVYTCHIPKEFRAAKSSEREDESRKSSSENNSSEDEEEYSEMLFEPDDLEPYLAKPKTNTFGLGYSGLSRHSVLGSFSTLDSIEGEWRGSHLVTSDKGRKVSIRGQAFGVGAMEEDDEDIYSKEDMTNYDFALEAAGKSKDKQSKSSAKQPVSHRSVLEGFVPTSRPTQPIKVYPPPTLPRNYVPSAPRVSRFSGAEGSSSDVPEIRDRGLGRHDLTAKSRGIILGESHPSSSYENTSAINENQALPSTSTKDDSFSEIYEERIAAVTGKDIQFVNDSESVDNREIEQAPANSSKFKPFASNPEKQLRYEKYIALKDRGITVTSDVLKTTGGNSRVTEWERIREMASFEQAYKLYQPLTGLMNDRFVSATRPDDDISILEKQNRDSSQYASKDKVEAARLGMFGKLTRETVRWVPDSMLCRRFNVAEPYNGGYANQGNEKKKLTYSIFEYLEAPVHNKTSFLNEQTNFIKGEPHKNTEEKREEKGKLLEDKLPIPEKEEPKGQKRLTVAELFLQEKDKERKEMLKKTRIDRKKEVPETNKKDVDPVKETIDNFNKIDLYKAVFLSDSESDLEIEESNKDTTKSADNNEQSSRSVSQNPFDSPPRNIERNKSPPKGIFANINFDRLNSWQNSSTRNNDDVLEIQVKETKVEGNMNDQEISVKEKREDSRKGKEDKGSEDAEYYGPKLPDKPVFADVKDKKVTEEITVIDVDSSSDGSDSWIEVDKTKSEKSKSKHKKVKKSSKKKRHEHRHKSKRKHKSRRQSSS